MVIPRLQQNLGVRWQPAPARRDHRSLPIGSDAPSGRSTVPAVDSRMSRHEKLLAQILGGRADANVSFDALCALLRHLGFEERTRSSHHMFRRGGVEELINLQRDGDKAKVYQVRQVRAILTKYGLTTTEPPEGA